MIDNHPNITQQSHPNISSKHNATIAKTMTFFLGNLVEVGKEQRTGRRDSDGGRAYILAINNDDDNDNNGNNNNNDNDGVGIKRPRDDSITYNVKYVVGGITSPNVKRRRIISSVIMDTIARQRLGETWLQDCLNEDRGSDPKLYGVEPVVDVLNPTPKAGQAMSHEKPKNDPMSERRMIGESSSVIITTRSVTITFCRSKYIFSEDYGNAY